MNLSSIIQSAQGGQAIDNLAARFGLTPEQAQSAVNALLPAFEMGLQNKLQNGGGLGGILSQIANPQHGAAFQDPSAAASPATVAQGGSVLGELFGSHSTSQQVAQQAAAESGVSASIIQAMLPVLASMIMGGLLHGAQNGAFGGALSSIVGSVLGGGGLGSVFGQAGTPQQPAPGPSSGQGDLGGILGSVLGGLFSGAGGEPTPSITPEQPMPRTTAPDAQPTGLPAGGTSDDVLDELSRSFQAGTPASPEHQASLANILGR